MLHSNRTHCGLSFEAEMLEYCGRAAAIFAGATRGLAGPTEEEESMGTGQHGCGRPLGAEP
jgi:hypothetical protein